MENAGLAAIGSLDDSLVTSLLLYPQSPVVARVERDGGGRLEGEQTEAALAPIIQDAFGARQLVPHERVLCQHTCVVRVH